MTRVSSKRRQKVEIAGGASLDISEDSHCHTDRLRMMVTSMNKELWVISLRAVYTIFIIITGVQYLHSPLAFIMKKSSTLNAHESGKEEVDG